MQKRKTIRRNSSSKTDWNSQTITPTCVRCSVCLDPNRYLFAYLLINLRWFIWYTMYTFRTKWKMRTTTNKVYCSNGITHHDRQSSLWLYICILLTSSNPKNDRWKNRWTRKKWNIFCDLKRHTRIEWCDRININHIGISRLFSPLACMSIILFLQLRSKSIYWISSIVLLIDLNAFLFHFEFTFIFFHFIFVALKNDYCSIIWAAHCMNLWEMKCSIVLFCRIGLTIDNTEKFVSHAIFHR